MTREEHRYWARKCLAYLVDHVKEFKGGKEYLTYGQLAKAIGYPQPHTGNVFGSNIGMTLGEMGHLLDDVVIDGSRVPMMQTMVVSSRSKLPSDGLKEFVEDYPKLPLEKKRDLVHAEHQRVFEFGSRWEVLLDQLGIEYTTGYRNASRDSGAYNPWGSEGSPEHIRLRDEVRKSPASVGVNSSAESYAEYPLKSGDCVDVVFVEADRVVGVEVKSTRSGHNDIQRGLFQTVKYRSVLEAEESCLGSRRRVEILLVLEDNLPRALYPTRKKLGVRVIEDFYSA